MTIQPPQTEPQPPASNGQHDNGVRAGTDLAEPREVLPKTTSRARRAPDYRLRGLDLDAQGVALAPARPVRKGRRRRWLRLFIQWVVVLTLTATVAALLRNSVVRSYSVSSASMVPTLQAGTDILVVKSSRLAGPIGAGSIVVFRQPEGSSCKARGNSSHDLVSRVIGLPGQTIWSSRGRIYVNGAPLNEPGWYNPPYGELGRSSIARTTIPPRSYFVMGDNRKDSCDSRSFGPVPNSLLVGKAVATTAHNGHLFVHSI